MEQPAHGMLMTRPVHGRELARERGIPTQEFSVRSDMACGSTIGAGPPYLTASLSAFYCSLHQ